MSCSDCLHLIKLSIMECRWDFMKTRISLLLVCCLLSTNVFAADRSSARIGISHTSNAGMRANTPIKSIDTASTVESTDSGDVIIDSLNRLPSDNKDNKLGGCRDNYRNCMNEFCLLDESEGARCACSSNIEKSKDLIIEIQKIQSDADKLYTEGVEKEKLGTRERRLLFGESENAKKSSRMSGLSFEQWLNSGSSEDEDTLGTDYDIGDNLYAMASEYCADKLKACGPDSGMEETLYVREIVSDCKSFNNYLLEQKNAATLNKAAGEKAVRVARLGMLDNTNKYNRGECLLSYKSCIADKGGCGVNFENCLDSDLLARRANACENILDGCTAVKNYVLADWEAESKTVLANAEKYADQNRRLTCDAKIRECLETGCSVSLDSAQNATCLNNIDIASGVCPIINECDVIIPGLKNSWQDNLGSLRIDFCQNDFDKCLQDKCGKNYDAPECIGKKTSEITALCPQTMFPSCVGLKQFNVIVQSALLQMNYQMLDGCVNYFSEQLGKVCGTDMSCLPADITITTLTEIPSSKNKKEQLAATVKQNAESAVDEFFKQFEQNITVSACKDSQKPTGRKKLGDAVFLSAKTIAYNNAVNRALRLLDTKMGEITRVSNLKEAEEKCYSMYEVEEPESNKSADETESKFGKKSETNPKNYSYIKSVVFESDLSNCHVCRVQQVCETGGESKATSALKAATGGLSAGAGIGTGASAGWGTAIGGVVGALGGVIGGIASGGEKTFCQEVESCEDINIKILQ